MQIQPWDKLRAGMTLMWRAWSCSVGGVTYVGGGGMTGYNLYCQATEPCKDKQWRTSHVTAILYCHRTTQPSSVARALQGYTYGHMSTLYC